MNTVERLYVNALSVPVGGSAGAPTYVHLPLDKPSCVMAYLTYTPGTAGNTVTVTLQPGKETGGVAFFDTTENTIALTGNEAFMLSLPGGPSVFQLLFSSAGTAGPDDIVSVVLSGLPIGTYFV